LGINEYVEKRKLILENKQLNEEDLPFDAQYL